LGRHLKLVGGIVPWGLLVVRYPPDRADESDEVASLCVGSSTEAPFQDKDAADEGGHC